LFLDDESLAENLSEIEYIVEELEINSSYEIVVTARAQNTYKTKATITYLTTSNDYSVHPEISVPETKLITPESQYFEGQLIVTFSEELNNFEIREWVAVSYEIANYSTNVSSVYSNVLSQENYNSLATDKTDYFLIEDNGVVYQLN